MFNKSKMSREEFELEQLLEIEKEQEDIRKKELLMLEQENKKKKEREKEALIDELMSSYDNADKILEDYAKKAEEIREAEKVVPVPKAPSSQFSTGIKFTRGGQQGFLPIPKLEEGPSYKYVEVERIFDGPIAPSNLEIEQKGYIHHIR